MTTNGSPAPGRVPLGGAAAANGSRPVLGLDIGGTKLAVAVVTADGGVHGLRIRPTRREEGPDAVLARLFALGHEAIQAAGLGPVGAVGIACGGPLDAPSGLLQSPPHLPGWVDVPVGPLAAAEFGVPFALENDATAAAVAEHRYGAGRGLRSLVYLTVSTGVGGGVILEDRLHRGAAGNGGELGHVTVRRGGRLCSCGRRGCIEAYASGSSIAARAAEALAAAPADQPPSALAALPVVTAADVSAAAAAGDPLAVRLWRETTDLLGSAVADLVNVLEPELVVLGGGVTRSGAMLLDPVRAIVAREAMPPAARAATVAFAGLGDVVCVVGAGAIALDVLAAGAPAASPHDHAPTEAARV
jgi:glucokinase